MKVVKKPEEKQKINPKEIQKSYLDKIEKDLNDNGVIFFEPEVNLNINNDYLQLPNEITEVTSKELGEYLNAFTQQKIYLRTLFGRLSLLAEEARREYYEASEEFYKKFSSEKISETAKERLINSQPEVKPLYYEFIDCQKKLSIIEHSITNIEDAIFMISREVTRRSGDFNEENRTYNVRENRRK